MLQVNTEEFKKKIYLLGLSIIKGIPISYNMKMIRFDTEGSNVYGYTYDGINNIRVLIGTSNTKFHAIIDYASFSSFIKACEGDTISLETKDSFMQIKSKNTKCKLPIQNTSVKDGGIPDPTGPFTYNQSLTESIDLSSLKTILNPSCVIDIYRKIYFGDNIMVSDTDNVLIIKKRIFDKDFLLNLSSVEILNNVTNIKYTYSTKVTSNAKLEYLNISADELVASMIIDTNVKNEFQYSDLMDLFGSITGNNVKLNISTISKATSTGAIFNQVPNMVFNDKGVFANIALADYIYKIDGTPCTDRKFVLESNLVKRMSSVGSDVTLYYEQPDLIKCEADDKMGIFCVKEVT